MGGPRNRKERRELHHLSRTEGICSLVGRHLNFARSGRKALQKNSYQGFPSKRIAPKRSREGPLEFWVQEFKYLSRVGRS